VTNTVTSPPDTVTVTVTKPAPEPQNGGPPAAANVE
jgi:hypothetical protein